MKRNSNKLTGVILIFACVLVGVNLCHGQSVSDTIKDYKVDDLYYNIYKSKSVASITFAPDGKAYSGKIVIPDSIEYEGVSYPVKKYERSGAPDYALPFYNTPDLESVKFGLNLATAYLCPFKNSGIREIIFPEEYLCVEDFKCENCPNLKELVFNSKLTDFGLPDMDCSLPEIPIKITGNARINYNTSGGSTIDLGDGAIIFHRPWNELATQNPTDGYVLTGKCRIESFFVGRDSGKWIEFPVLERFEPIEVNTYRGKETIEDSHYAISKISYPLSLGKNNIEKIICYDPTPWPADNHTFLYYTNSGGYDSTMYETIDLFVPATAIATYKADPVWGKFKTILPIEEAVNDVVIDSDEANAKAPVEFFDMMGRRVTNPRPGEMVIRRQGSRTTKMIAD